MQTRADQYIPREIMQEIFFYLPRDLHMLPLVCKYWEECSRHLCIKLAKHIIETEFIEFTKEKLQLLWSIKTTDDVEEVKMETKKFNEDKIKENEYEYVSAYAVACTEEVEEIEELEFSEYDNSKTPSLFSTHETLKMNSLTENETVTYKSQQRYQKALNFFQTYAKDDELLSKNIFNTSCNVSRFS